MGHFFILSILEKGQNKRKIQGKVLAEYDSPISGKIRVKIIDGKKVVNTDNTNYSYGILEDVLNHGLDQIPLNNINSILVLGMGAGCVIPSLRKRYDCHAPVTAVELDPILIEIADKEYGLKDSEELKVIQGDAYDYVLNTQDKFDLVVIDIFVDLQVPEQFYSNKFWENMERIVNLNGFVVFNTGIDLSEDDVYDFVDGLPDNFLYQVMFEVYESNTVVSLNKFHE